MTQPPDALNDRDAQERMEALHSPDERHDAPPDFTDPEECWVDAFLELRDLLPEWDTQKVMRHLARLNDLEAMLP